MSTSRIAAAVVLVAASVALAGCGGAKAHRAPDVVGQRLDLAQDRLEAVGLRYDTIGGGTFGVVVRSHWFVCEQEPKAGTRTKSVRLVVSRACERPRPAPLVVPNVVGDELDDAEEELERLGFDVEAYPTDDGPIVARELWTVCEQYPAGGEPGTTVDLYVQHDCYDDD